MGHNQTAVDLGSGRRPSHAYVFPRYHRIGQAVRPVLTSRYWIAAVLAIAVLLYSPFLVSGFFQDDYGFRIQFHQEARARVDLPDNVLRSSPWDLYNFSSDAASFAIGRERGFVPWWASAEIQTRFFRPLSSLSLALDYSLWPDAPVLPHIHSLLWFCLLLVVAHRLYWAISGSALVAGISILLLAVDDVFTGPAGWISNRHAVIAMVLGVLSVWLYHRAVAEKQRLALVGAVIAYVLALFSSEMGLVTFAYLLAYALVLDRDPWPNRIGRILAFIGITVVWRLLYTWLGYGAQGTLLYIDPILNPMDFISQALTRYPLPLFSAVGLPVADLLLAFSPGALAMAAVLSLLPLALLGLILYPLLRTHRTAVFWLIGLLCAGVPLVSGIPGNRNLGFVSVGVMGLAGQLLADMAAMQHPRSLPRLQAVLLRIATPVLLILFLVVSPLLVVSNPGVTNTMSTDQASVADFGDEPALATQHLNVINPPGTMIYIPGLFQRMFGQEPFPASVNYLSSGFTPVHIARVDDRTILVTPEGGYTPLPSTILDKSTGMSLPIHQENVFRALEQTTYNPRNPMQVSQVVILSEVTIQITEMTDDGRIAQAAFTFTHPLEDERYVWLFWHETTSTYERVQMPGVGEAIIY